MDAATRMDDPPDLYARLTRLNDIGVALSRETDIARLLEAILVAAKTITHADGGTLYRVTDERTLSFEVMRNDTLNLAMGGTTGAAVPFAPIALYGSDGVPVTSMVAAYAVRSIGSRSCSNPSSASSMPPSTTSRRTRAATASASRC